MAGLKTHPTNLKWWMLDSKGLKFWQTLVKKEA